MHYAGSTMHQFTVPHNNAVSEQEVLDVHIHIETSL